MGLVRNFGETDDESVPGGRHKLYIQQTTEFFRKLKSFGASLVFICDGSLQQNRIKLWCERRTREYKETLNKLYAIDSKQYQCSNQYSRLGCYDFVNSLMKIAEEEGKVIYATEHDCDSTAAQYATKHNAVAIITSDSDYLFHDGDWQHWHMESIQMEQLTVNRFNRDALTNKLQLNRKQLKVFATIAGNDYTQNLEWRHPKDFGCIAKFCRSLNTTQNDKFYSEIVKYMSSRPENKQRSSGKGLGGSFKQQKKGKKTWSAASKASILETLGNNMDSRRQPLPVPEKIKIQIVKDSIESYSIKFEVVTKLSKLETYVSQNVLMNAILKNKIFQYNASYLSFISREDDNSDSVANKIFKTLRRLSGVLLYHKQHERKTFQLLTKRSPEDEYDLKTEQAEFPKSSPLFRKMM